MRCRTERSKCPGAEAARVANNLRRRGVSLVELMVVVSIVTVLFGMVGVVFHRMFLSEQVAMRAALAERTVSRLAEQFRRDVHAAAAATRLVNPESGQVTHVTLESSRDATAVANHSSSVLYFLGPDEVIRHRITDGKTASREVYRLPDCKIRLLDSMKEGMVEMVGLVIERQGSTVTPQPQAVRPWRSLVIEAALGRDGRLATALATKSPESVKEESK